MTLGLQGGIVLKQFDVSGLIFPSEINQLTGETTSSTPIHVSNDKTAYPNFAAGAVGQHNDFFWGSECT